MSKGTIIDPEKAQLYLGVIDSPFIPGLRVYCPLKNYDLIKSYHCASCHLFRGLLKADVTPGSESTKTDIITSKYRIICGHPLTRRLVSVPED